MLQTENFKNMRNPNIYSAEMTALLRCSYPTISNDTISQFLVSSIGIRNTHQFLVNFNYPLMTRLISVRAGFFLNESIRLLSTGQYDACVSIASGFSLLTYIISQSIPKNIAFIDCDLQDMVEERQRRIQSNHFLQKINNKISQSCDIDIKALTERKIPLRHLFPEYKKPLFILEGLSYFLPKLTLNWLLNEICVYDHAALIFDFCSSSGIQQYPCLERLMKKIPGFLLNGESMYGVAEKDFNFLYKNVNQVNLYDITEAEERLSHKCNDDILLNNRDDFIPTKIIVLEK